MLGAKKERLLAVALGKGGSPADSSDEEEDLGTSEDSADEGGEDGYMLDCAQDLVDSVESGDLEGIVEAIRAIAGK